MTWIPSRLTFSNFLAQRAKFLMDAALGVINIAQDKRLNIFTGLE
jgi:hypothetical protein